MPREVLIGQADYSVLVFIPDSASTDGSGKTGLVAANLTAGYTRVETDNDVVHTDGTSSLNNLANLTAAHADWGVLEVSSTLAPGMYRLDLPDGVFATGAWSAVVYVMVTTGAAVATPIEFVLIGYDKQVAALPANVTQLSGDTTAADNAEAFFDGTGYAGTNNVIPTVTALTGHTAQSGDAYARLGAAGAGLTALGDTRLANLDATVSSRAAASVLGAAVSTSISADIAAVKADTAAVKAKTDNLPSDPADASVVAGLIGAVDAKIGTPLDLGGGATLASNLSDIEGQTDDIGAAGAGLTAADDAILSAISALNNLSQANIRTALGMASANLDTQLADLPTNAELASALGTADDAVLAAIAALNNLSQANIRTALGMASANLDTQIADLPTNAELATALGTADDAVLAAIAALNNLSAAQVNAEVLDVMRTDTGTEVSTVPASAASIGAQIQFLYQALRNKVDITATAKKVYTDAGVQVGSKTLSEDGTTYSETKMA